MNIPLLGFPATNEHHDHRKAWLASVAVAVAYEGLLAQGVQSWVLGDAPRYKFDSIIQSFSFTI